MNFTWREKRKYLITFILAVFIFSYAFYKFYPTLFPAPTHYDGIQNLDEKGVDCGAMGIVICKDDVIPLTVNFAKAVETEKDLYDLVAIVSNKNKDKNPADGKINFIFSVYDKSGSVVQSVYSSSTIPMGQDFPIIIQNVYLPISKTGNAISNVSLEILSDKDWYEENSSYADIFFKTNYTNFKNGKNDGVNPSRLTVQIQNLTKNYFRDVPVSVLLYDKDENLIAVNESLLDEIYADQIKTINFTWRKSLTSEPLRVEVYSVVTPYTYFR